MRTKIYIRSCTHIINNSLFFNTEVIDIFRETLNSAEELQYFKNTLKRVGIFSKSYMNVCSKCGYGNHCEPANYESTSLPIFLFEESEIK